MIGQDKHGGNNCEYDQSINMLYKVKPYKMFRMIFTIHNLFTLVKWLMVDVNEIHIIWHVFQRTIVTHYVFKLFYIFLFLPVCVILDYT
jgi:aromatic ring-cleaving dioxygenase